jgi:hypothetical protein
MLGKTGKTGKKNRSEMVTVNFEKEKRTTNEREEGRRSGGGS